LSFSKFFVSGFFNSLLEDILGKVIRDLQVAEKRGNFLNNSTDNRSKIKLALRNCFCLICLKVSVGRTKKLGGAANLYRNTPRKSLNNNRLTETSDA
jgi:hypothetical protein